MALFLSAASSRPDFDGLQHGVDRSLTLSHLKSLEAAVPAACDSIYKEELLQQALGRFVCVVDLSPYISGSCCSIGCMFSVAPQLLRLVRAPPAVTLRRT